MKITLIFLSITIFCVQVWAEPPAAIDQTKFIEDSKCLAKENLSFADVLDFSINDKMELAEKNPKLKCFASCLMEFGKILDGCTVVYTKNLNMEAFGDKKEEFVKIMESCKDVVKGTDRCECGYQLIKCMTEKDKKP
ncbi:uncharacterized protein LOC129919210 [Episyrphus balteatus]|uniref:uncharacterized protein LOC129919210 n=1 Tax=Episyrphus balteatus TaxID=286459 RepID=UPI0024865740|nr:uncharacterized protein LOC129919210 [Episyrphus balteatus]